MANRGLMPDYAVINNNFSKLIKLFCQRKKIFKKKEVKILKNFLKQNPDLSQGKLEQMLNFQKPLF